MGLQTFTSDQVFQNLVNAFLRAYFNLAPNAPIPDVDVGSLLGSIFRADSELFIAGQANVQYAYAAGRMQTSTGEDVFSFGMAFGINPLGAVAAITSETFSTSSAAVTPIAVPLGVVVQRTDGTTYVVVPGSTQTYVPNTTSGWDVTTNRWLIAVGQTSVNVTLQCTVAGSIGNCIANTITIISGSGTPVPQISSVTNVEIVDSGSDAETPQAYAQRFTTTMASGNRTGTELAIIAAALAVQTGLIYSYGDNINPNTLTQDLGWFTLFVNQANTGTTPPDSLITAVTTAVEPVRPAATYYKVLAPTISAVTASALFTFKTGIDPDQGIAAAQAQFASYVNGTGIQPDNTTLSRVSLGAVYAQLLLNTQINGIACVSDVQNLLLNGVAADVTAPFGTQLCAGTTTFSHT